MVASLQEPAGLRNAVRSIPDGMGRQRLTDHGTPPHQLKTVNMSSDV